MNDTAMISSLPTHLDEASKLAFAHYERGQYNQAIEYQKKVVDQLSDDYTPTLRAEEHHRLGGYFSAANRLEEAKTSLLQSIALCDKNPQYYEHLMVCLNRLLEYDEALKYIDHIIQSSHISLSNNFIKTCIHCYSKVDQNDLALRYATQALLFQYKIDKKRVPRLVLTEKPPFNPHKQHENIIAYSLWGENAKYFSGARLNIVRAQRLFPAWTCRFYCATNMSTSVKNSLRALGAQVVDMDLKGDEKVRFTGTFWRFLVASDPSVNYFMVRDTDSLIGIREKLLVENWLRSSAYFHLIRDESIHADTMLAGMWGGVANVLPSMSAIIAQFNQIHGDLYGIDQLFLRREIWPYIKQSVYTDNRGFTTPDGHQENALLHHKIESNIGKKTTFRPFLPVFGTIRHPYIQTENTVDKVQPKTPENKLGFVENFVS